MIFFFYFSSYNIFIHTRIKKTKLCCIFVNIVSFSNGHTPNIFKHILWVKKT